MLLEIFIIMKESSLLLLHRSFTKKKFNINGDVFSGLISGLSMMLNELEIGQIQHFRTGDHKILISPYKEIVIVGIVEGDTEEAFINESLKQIAETFYKEFKDKITKWEGDLAPFENFAPIVDSMVYTWFEKKYISEDFPKNIVKVIRKYQGKLEGNVVHYIGYKAGKRRGRDLKNEKSFKKTLSKEIGLFSINNIHEEANKAHREEYHIKVPVCPFCRGIKEKNFACNFFTGFIRGFSMRTLPDKEIFVKETKCIAHGDESCEFSLVVV
ncbi:MAG: V4R domain-containing protein [Candidatus Hodarchaeota archaeon]